MFDYALSRFAGLFPRYTQKWQSVWELRTDGLICPVSSMKLGTSDGLY